MEKFSLLRLTVTYGRSAAILFSLAAALAVLGIFWAQPMLAAALAALTGALLFVALKSYVELVTLVTDMLLPR